ncbi:DUF2909 family protein [Motilimonas sp. 1_MG-2023]|uniref:DUF2909 family protein n=1 Tax=Motilimonas TaxID=1914248 RepID=UPI0026E27913|nr:DUF2909 family protein [Motilimonas sp. 1_MG-2023]MDO6524778.1 DUF2909 family protein [Motilimonas sp. 1_MG-2023]
MVIKIVIIGVVLAVLINLALALPTLLKQPDKSLLTRYLGRRLFGSALVLLIIFIAIALGLITPNPAPWQ